MLEIPGVPTMGKKPGGEKKGDRHKASYLVRVDRPLYELGALLAALQGKTFRELVKALLTDALRERGMFLVPFDDDDLLRDLGKLAVSHPELIPVLERVGAVRPGKRP